MNFPKVLNGFDLYSKPSINLQYGTAGFRAKADLLDHVAFRIGILANLRSLTAGKAVGVMITASHNPEEDNGMKVIDTDGGMLNINWEDFATDLVNCDKTDVMAKINAIIADHPVKSVYKGQVLIGWDSRPSSDRLLSITCEGVCSVGGEAIKTDLCPTPVLHYLVACKSNSSYGIASIEGYYQKLITAFNFLWNKVNPLVSYYQTDIYFDGANGVGAHPMKKARDQLKDKINIHIVNDSLGMPGKLNHCCGADFVKTQQCPPENVPFGPNLKCVSFDGDGDRILYYYTGEDGKFQLLDGDRIAVLIATFLKQLVDECKLNPSFGIVQTAYANGNSTKYIIEKLALAPICAKTGVKHLHKEAVKYDIGVYFEANGHGTVVFSEKLKNMVSNELQTADVERREALNKLHHFIDLVNETVGDGFSDFLVIETILKTKGWSLKNWLELYSDLPNRLSKINVKDRKIIKTYDAERKVEEPRNMQRKIDELTSKYRSGRSFVRPSGTEDIIRVYAEAETSNECSELSTLVSQLVFDMADGVGTRP